MEFNDVVVGEQVVCVQDVPLKGYKTGDVLTVLDKRETAPNDGWLYFDQDQINGNAGVAPFCFEKKE